MAATVVFIYIVQLAGVALGPATAKNIGTARSCVTTHDEAPFCGMWHPKPEPERASSVVGVGLIN